MLATLCVVVLNTNFLGSAGQGTVALINLGILVQVALSSFIGGGALVYLVPRMDIGKILAVSILWSLASAFICFELFQFVQVVPYAFILHTVILGLIQSVVMLFQQVLLGRERIAQYNFTVALQAVSLPCVILYLYVVMHDAGVQSFIVGAYFSFVITLLVSTRMAWPLLRVPDFSKSGSTFRQIFSYGKFAQGGNIFHLLNLRLQYVLLELLVANARSLVGILSVAMYAAEAVWSIGKSLSVVQYARIANTQDHEQNKSLTLSFLRISLLCGAVATLLIALLPDSFFEMILGSDFDGLQYTLVLLAPGIAANCCSIVFAHYYSGTGAHKKNMMASGLGLAGAIVIALLLLPSLGLAGAAAAVSISLVIQFVFFVVSYASKNKLRPTDFVIRKSDFLVFRSDSSGEMK